jgi:sarcosine oxidase
VVVASPCSGHGFKFASVIGEMLADLATKGTSSLDLSLFNINRFEQPQPT